MNRYPEKCYPFKCFENKKILDIGASDHLYVLCDDGVYTIPSKVELDKNALDAQIVPIKLSIFEENIPVMFSSYFKQKKNMEEAASAKTKTGS